MASDNRDRKQPAARGFVLGAERFAKISAVEGIELSKEMRERAEDAARRGLSAEQRLEEIKEVYRKA
jgi:hypothetical protein